MDSIVNLQDFGGKEIPDFILKLYTILEKEEFKDVISWAAAGTEVHIKDQKRMEDTILPTYFRHKKIESFIRQLNMYRFSKVNKISKEKKHMFFKNDLFRKGNLRFLHLIRRKRKGQQDAELVEPQRDFQDYKMFIKENVLRIQEDLNSLRKKHPEVSSELASIINFTGVLTGDNALQSPNSQTDEDEESAELKDQLPNSNILFQSNRNLTNLRSLRHFDSRCSIDFVFGDNILI